MYTILFCRSRNELLIVKLDDVRLARAGDNGFFRVVGLDERVFTFPPDVDQLQGYDTPGKAWEVAHTKHTLSLYL